MFDTKLRDTQTWRNALIEGDKDTDSKTIAGQEERNSYGDQMASG